LHLIAPVVSTRTPHAFFTAPGLGDRIHLVTVLWCLHHHSGREVVLHLNGRQVNDEKRSSFNEILDIFPSKSIKIVYHKITPQDDSEFISFLANNGIQAERFFYGDFPGWNEKREGLDISKFLQNIPPIVDYEPQTDATFVTEQWDSTGSKRRLSRLQIETIRRRYSASGHSIITVGGSLESGQFRYSLKEVVNLMSRASAHIGVDSGFMHLAQLVIPSSKIHLFSDLQNFWSHHLFRARARGVLVSSPKGRLGKLFMIYVNLRYNSPRLLRVLHVLRGH